MLKGASRAVLKILEQELHEAWRSGYQEGKSEVAHSAVPAILSARFGPEAGSVGGTVKFVPHDRLAEIVVLAATCSDLASFREGIMSGMWSAMRKRKS
jgi:hypothetical protein